MIKNFQDYNNIIKYDNAVAELAEPLKEKLMQSFTIIFSTMVFLYINFTTRKKGITD